ncbi:MAG: ComF family protein [Candidatus Woesebacteria bacterium]|jgi:ComF family protein
MEVADIIFPKRCLGCKRQGRYICKICIGWVAFSKPVCGVCHEYSFNGVTHPGCRAPLFPDVTVNIWRYKGVVKTSILSFKYSFALKIADELSNYLYDVLITRKRVFPKTPILIPIPLHRLRKNWRGFNQSEEVGGRLAEKMGWEYLDDALVRTKHTAPQTKLKRDKRKENIRGAFSFKQKRLPEVKDRDIILFDDVFTSGSTINEACKLLKQKGCGKVVALTIAR